MHVRTKAILLSLTMLLGFSAHASQPLGIAYFSGSVRSKIGALIMVEVYKRANIDAVAVSMPGARTTPSAEASQVVGESVRVYSYADAHPSLTRVEPAVTVWTTVAFYIDTTNVRIHSITDLKNFKVGYVRGTQAAQDVIAEQKLTNLEGAGTPDVLFRMLNAGRFDIALDGGTNGDYWIRKNGYQHMARFKINEIPLYHVLSPKYKSLAPTLSIIIKQMTTSGELAKITAKAESEVLDSGAD